MRIQSFGFDIQGFPNVLERSFSTRWKLQRWNSVKVKKFVS